MTKPARTPVNWSIGRGRHIHHSDSGAIALCVLSDVFAIFLALLLSIAVVQGPATRDVILITPTVTLIYSQLALLVRLYRKWLSSRLIESGILVLMTWSLSLFLTHLALRSLPIEVRYDFEWLISFAMLSLITLIGYRALMVTVRERRIRRHQGRKRAIIIGYTEAGQKLAKSIGQNPHLGIQLLGFADDRPSLRTNYQSTYPLIGNTQDAIEMARNNKVNRVYIALPMRAERRITDILTQCGNTTASIHIVPDFFVYNFLHAQWHEVGDTNTLSIFATPIIGIDSWLKRAEDIVLSTLILALISAPMLLIALLVKLTSKGPVIFRQDRYGLDGQKIQVWKFRSMYCTENDTVKQVTRNDNRVTPLGRILRRTSLDELPQFINVLQGQMSVVGPRPHAVAHNEEYRGEIKHYMLRHHVKPGITGWAQINGWRGETDTLDKMEKRVEFDLAYIRNWSLWFDIKIVFKTIFIGFWGREVY